MSGRFLLADEDAAEREALTAACRAAGYETVSVAGAAEALASVAARHPDVIVLGVRLLSKDGFALLPRLVAGDAPPSLVALASRGDVPLALEALQRGADDFLEKPVRSELLLAVLGRVLRCRAVLAERDRLRAELALASGGPLLALSAPMRRLLERLERVAAAPRTTVLIRGEAGVGKELVARTVHERSDRRAAPFVVLDCASVGEPRLAAELFGHEPGAFPGALPSGAPGLLAAAEGGTLLLREIGELGPGLQARMLRVLEERAYRRVGGDRDVLADVRLMASTRRDLESLVAAGAFREDLFYRLNVLSLRAPPLRARREDLLPLAQSFLRRFAADTGRELTGFSPAAAALLLEHAWPGNVRELRNAVERAALVAGGARVEPADLGLARNVPAPLPRSVEDPGDRFASFPRELSLRAWEEALIRRALRETAGNKAHAARTLGVNRATLYNKLKRYGLGQV
jgi:DNA-binding NtrC family response regulator